MGGVHLIKLVLSYYEHKKQKKNIKSKYEKSKIVIFLFVTGYNKLSLFNECVEYFGFALIER